MIFLVFGSSLAHIEPELELFDDISDDGDDDLSYHYLPNFRRQSFAGKSDSTFYNI